MTAPKLLIASVYAPSEWNSQWYGLQQQFLTEMTPHTPFEFAVLLNGIEARELPVGANIIGKNSDNLGHSAAMRQIVDFFRASEGFTHFLFLDSDCFPIHNRWFETLTEQMSQFGKHFAAPVRTENLDRFPHPCAFLCDSQGIDDHRINFDIGYEDTNILGEPVKDVGNAMLPLLPEILPLLRTNLVNLHPVAAGVYHHLFYHHGAGSREIGFRVIGKYGYYDHWWEKENDTVLAGQLRNTLFKDPHGFLSLLMNPIKMSSV